MDFMRACEHRKYMILTAIAALQIFLFILCIACIFHHIAARAYSSRVEVEKEECYISVQVRPGESLWKISSRYYSSEYKSMHQYIKKIINLNHMPDETIHAGAYLIIPYYEIAQ